MKSKIAQKWGLLTLNWLLGASIGWQMNLLSVVAAPVKFKMPPPPPQRGIPGNRTSAASRDNCPTVSQPLTALVPEYRANPVDRVWGLTSMESPTLLFYVPYAKTAIVDISFTIQDESNPADTKIVYRNLTIAPTQTPGVMQVALPKSLAPNTPYHWFLKLNMECRRGQRPIFVDGWIQRAQIDRNLSVQLERATPAAKVSLYAENGLWYDAIATLASLRSTKPQDTALTQDWQNLLNAIDLGHLASQPLN
jgi:Domain of Unknown Function (DUF928)